MAAGVLAGGAVLLVAQGSAWRQIQVASPRLGCQAPAMAGEGPPRAGAFGSRTLVGSFSVGLWRAQGDVCLGRADHRVLRVAAEAA